MDSNAVVENLNATTKIKRENCDEDIKKFAEIAMNELLGWYGYGTNREDPKMTASCLSHAGSNSSGPDSPKYADGCEWCGKAVDEAKGLCSAGVLFCSELCFSQSRRANFKRNKTCDWCRHVRHTVSYVDFQDGASQLQFCSDKCLNQYKMHIFCRETRAHLEMHPHLPEEGSSSGTGLITPDLWMKNCRSPEPESPTPSVSPKPAENLPQTSPLPLITVTHPSKLMAQENLDASQTHQKQKVHKKHKRKCTSTVTGSTIRKSPPSEIPQDLRVRHSPPLNGFENLSFRDALRPPPYNINSLHQMHPPLFNLPNIFSGNGPRMMNSQLFSPPPLPLPPLARQQPSENFLPPVTVLVPYPIIIPLPLPIPIPIPIPNNFAFDSKRKVEEISKDISVKLPDETSTILSDKETYVENDTLKVEENNDKDDDDSSPVVVNGISKTLRKRKRAVEAKNKYILSKSKKHQ